jgi:hypothetical protein
LTEAKVGVSRLTCLHHFFHIPIPFLLRFSFSRSLDRRAHYLDSWVTLWARFMNSWFLQTLPSCAIIVVLMLTSRELLADMADMT